MPQSRKARRSRSTYHGSACSLLGCVLIWGAVLGSGYWLYGNYLPAAALSLPAALAGVALMRLWSRTSVAEQALPQGQVSPRQLP